MFTHSLKSNLIDNEVSVVNRTEGAIWKALHKNLPAHALERVKLDKPIRLLKNFQRLDCDLDVKNILEIKRRFDGMVFAPIDKSPGEVLVCCPEYYEIMYDKCFKVDGAYYEHANMTLDEAKEKYRKDWKSNGSNFFQNISSDYAHV